MPCGLFVGFVGLFVCLVGSLFISALVCCCRLPFALILISHSFPFSFCAYKQGFMESKALLREDYSCGRWHRSSGRGRASELSLPCRFCCRREALGPSSRCSVASSQVSGGRAVGLQQSKCGRGRSRGEVLESPSIRLRDERSEGSRLGDPRDAVALRERKGADGQVFYDAVEDTTRKDCTLSIQSLLLCLCQLPFFTLFLPHLSVFSSLCTSLLLITL